jgi:hypothetical protein
MAVVEDLAARGATGVLEVTGDPSGVLYLDSGHIVFAAASWVPGLIDRLRGTRPASVELKELLAGWDADDAAVAAVAVQRGYLTAARLHELIRSIVVDAFLVLVIPLPENSHVADIRFTSARTHANTMFPRLDIPSVRREALSRADRQGTAPAGMAECRGGRGAGLGAPTHRARLERHGRHEQPATADILRRVLDGLRQLS